ncbi:RHS repeat domain-containing protein [Pseudomonas sp. CGJS7]|uniref:RHS repeat domain-containing protein n=1 Tax=Pseudomonas sp. CGJS7 TaxID=3109348 RepID=UPI0030081B8F
MKWISKFVTVAIFAIAASAANAQTVVEYIHTDALGSPVAVTDANQNVIERTEYEPYGAQANRPVLDGPGYTSHVSDAVTGLSYMQQRYFDSGVGRFLSVDPVSAYSAPGVNFNRYKYANNNPYKFVDPDGRCEAPTGTRICVTKIYTAKDITVVQSYDAKAQLPIPLPEGSTKAAELRPNLEKAADALNRAGKEIANRRLQDHAKIFNSMKVYMSVDQIGTEKAFVTKPPVYDMVINAAPFSKLWAGHQIGLMLHEIHHFTPGNVRMYNLQRDSGEPMGTGTPYEDDAYDFQRRLGFPSSGPSAFDKEQSQ